MTLRPTRQSVPFNTIQRDYQAPFIHDALAQYIVRFNHPGYNNAQIERDASLFTLPFRSLPVFHKAKLWIGSTMHHCLMADE